MRRPYRAATIVSLDNCNGCHYSLSAHGGSRTNPQYCVFCHNPADYDSAGAPRFEGTTNVDAEALDFRHLLHKVHAGTQLTEPYVIGGYPLPSATDPGGHAEQLRGGSLSCAARVVPGVSQRQRPGRCRWPRRQRTRRPRRR